MATTLPAMPDPRTPRKARPIARPGGWDATARARAEKERSVRATWRAHAPRLLTGRRPLHAAEGAPGRPDDRPPAGRAGLQPVQELAEQGGRDGVLVARVRADLVEHQLHPAPAVVLGV